MIGRTTLALAAAAVFCVSGAAFAQNEQTLLLRQPDLSDDHLVFTYAGDIWIADRTGEGARRLTSDPADERFAFISPDGERVAFTADYGGGDDVYVIDVDGGQPERLTWHRGTDETVGWTPDGAVLFSSARETDHGRAAQLWRVEPGEGQPERVMDARFFRGEMDADGERLAYIAFGPAYNALYGGTSGWRQHRGGTTPSITVYDLASDEAETIPGERVNDINPMWVDDEIWFLSDRDEESLALHRWDGEGEPEKVLDEGPWDIRWANAHDGAIVYEAGGRLFRYDVADDRREEIDISIRADLPQLARRWVDASDTIQHVSLSPTGQRAIVTARGEVFTVPLDEGSVRNVSGTGDRREYSALWSPRGQDIAWISDGPDGQSLHVVDQRGFEEPEIFELAGDPGSFRRLHAYTPDGRRIVYSDSDLNLHVINLENGRSETIATQQRRADAHVAVSRDSEWLAYTVAQRNFLSDLFLYNFETGQSARVTDGMADAASPAFSNDGRYLFFAASTNTGPRQVGLNMSTQERPARFGLYAAILNEDGRSPLLPESGDENGGSVVRGDEDENARGSESEEDEEETGREVELDAISERIMALPVAERNYSNLAVARSGDLYFIERPQPGVSNEPPNGGSGAPSPRLRRFDFDTGRTTTAENGVSHAELSADGKTFLIRKGGGWATADAEDSLDPEDIDLSGLRLEIDPLREWRLIFDEVWRMQAAYFYDPDLQGLDWSGVRDRYEPLLDHLARREDLNALLAEMIGELQAGHNRIGGGDVHSNGSARAGLLGANMSVQNDRWRIDRIYSGERWNPYLVGPLAAPGLGVSEGDYILAVNGRELTGRDNLWAALMDTAGEQISLLVNSDPRANGAEEIVVEPVSSESQLRLWGWVESNRQAVAEATNGRVGYVYLPNTAGAGYAFFNRMYYAQFDRDALIFDERANGGGQAANYVTDILDPMHLGGWLDRAGLPFNTPAGAHYGPKLMMIDQDAGSGGDFLPYAFRRAEIGPLIGTRTWGGLIGISANPELIDGGYLTVPYFRFYTPEGDWAIENEGVAPDIDVALDPVATNQGRDAQLERTIDEALDLLDLTDRAPVPLAAPEPPEEVGQ